MLATSHHIVMRRKFPPMGVASIDDFSLWRARQTEMPSQATPYCLDVTTGQVCFVETSADKDLTQSAFLYRTQYEQAQKAYSVTYTTFHEAMQHEAAPIAPIFICGIGRSGTTLVHHALNSVASVTSWPEPDVFTQMVRMRLSQPDTNIVPLLRDCVTYFYHQRDTERIAFKTRSFVTEIIDALYAAFPDAKIIFIYRDAVDWVQSNMRLLTRFPVPNVLLRTLLKRIYAAYFPVLQTLDLDSLSLVEIITHIWLAYMQRYEAHCAAGIPMLAVDYDDLIAKPDATLAQILDFCNLQIENLDFASTVFNEDSQHDTAFSQSRLRYGYTLSDIDVQSIQRIVQPINNYVGAYGNTPYKQDKK